MSNEKKFRLIFATPAPAAEAFSAARAALLDWCRDQPHDLAALAHTAASLADGGQAGQWRLRDGPRHALSLTVHAPADAASAWFWLEASSREVLPLARALLVAVPARDSLAVLAPGPIPVTSEVDALIDVLCDPGRRLPVMVASPHQVIDAGQWTATITRVTRDTAGLASTYILDEAGAAAFNAALGESHGVWGGALRTYLPEVDPAVPDDGLRHRVMLASRIAGDPQRVGAILADLPRRLGLDAPVPLALAGVNRLLLAQSRAAACGPAEGDHGEFTTGDGEPAGGDPGRQAKRIERLRRERDEALGLAEEQEDRANALYAERQDLLDQLAEREQQVLQLESAVRALRQQLIESGVATGPVYGLQAPPGTPPGEFAELLDWIERHLPRVEYTGDIDQPLGLDSSPESSTWVRSSWEALRALQAYAAVKAERGFPGDFRAWCMNPPSPQECIISPNKVKMDESETVHSRPKWRQERVFRVPPAVASDGRLFMGAHITIGASANGRINPRLYFHDGVLKTGRIYVGYIGRHLTNTLS
ncbi:MAG TPA: hypothetical protein VH478_07465 [Trebonia sp.]|jgi:hypothetical protein|nr:hypothetical protein [Trebonia sp.]